MFEVSPDATLASTPHREVTDHTDTSDYLGHTFHSVVGPVELWLGAQAVVFNVLVISYYRGMFQRAIPMMYLMIAGCDMITGVAAFLTGVLILSVKNHVQVAIDMSYVAYPVYSVAIPTSIFLNVTLAVIRTITLQRPLYQVRRKLVSGVVCLCALGWAIFTGWHLTRWDRARTLLRRYIYSPGQFQAAYHQGTSTQMECTNVVLFVVVPYLLPSVVVLVCMAVQVHLIMTWRRRQSGDTEQQKESGDMDRWRQQRHITVTILCLTLLFFLCNTVFLYLPVSYCLRLLDQDRSWIMEEGRRRGMLGHITGVVFPFINAAFSPVILVIRGRVISRMFNSKQNEGQVKETVLSNNCTVDNIVSTKC